MSEKMDPIGRVGPLQFAGPAVERVALVKENNDFEAVDVAQWRANIDAQDADMAKGDVEFFETLRKRMG